MRVSLIATDLDGTLLDSQKQISSRTRRALERAEQAGITVIPVTARQPFSVRELGDGLFRGWALCGNGAQAIHLTTGEVLFEVHLPPAVMAAVARSQRERLPGTVFSSVRDSGKTFAAEAGYTALVSYSDHHRAPNEMGAHPLEDVVAFPSLKLLARHPSVSPPDLLAHLRDLKMPGCEVTHSGAPFVEILAAGVSKAWGLEMLCGHLGVAREDVLAFGDALNDVEMLSWAGRGVAVANACPEALAAADEVTFGNDEDGVAVVVESLLN